MARPLELNYCPQCGHALEVKEAFGRSRRFCPQCGRIVFREHKVAAGVIVERDGSILLVRRRLNPQQGLWSLPAGFVDAGESPAEAALRETTEETGLRVEIIDLVGVFTQGDYGDADIVVIYRARWPGGDPMEKHLRAADDVDRVAFFDPENLPSLAFGATQAAIHRWCGTRQE